MIRLSRPVRRTTTSGPVPHGVKSEMVITLYPGGLIGLRELGRRREYTISAGVLYARLVGAEAWTTGRRR